LVLLYLFFLVAAADFLLSGKVGVEEWTSHFGKAMMPLKRGPLNPVAFIDCAGYLRKRKTEISWRKSSRKHCAWQIIHHGRAKFECVVKSWV